MFIDNQFSRTGRSALMPAAFLNRGTVTADAASCIRRVSPLGIKPVQRHTADMSQRRHIRVIFACPQCAVAYSAVQQSGSGFGSFDCWDCKTEIYRWSAPYIYSDWNEITLTTPNSGETIQ